jgi:hypothetical protein
MTPPITDFDPLQCLEDLQRGFVALAENQRELNQNQLRLQEAMNLILETQRRLDQRQDLLAQAMGLVIETQKTP